MVDIDCVGGANIYISPVTEQQLLKALHDILVHAYNDDWLFYAMLLFIPQGLL